MAREFKFSIKELEIALKKQLQGYKNWKLTEKDLRAKIKKIILDVEHSIIKTY